MQLYNSVDKDGIKAWKIKKILTHTKFENYGMRVGICDKLPNF